jgi:hypothetical protein
LKRDSCPGIGGFCETRQDQKRTSSCHTIINTFSTQKNERILNAVREKHQVTYESKPIRLTDFSTETLKASRAWNGVFHVPKT